MFVAYKATSATGHTLGYGGGNLPLQNVHQLQKGRRLVDPRAVHNAVCVGKVGFHVCPFPAQCKVFLPHAPQVWEVHIPRNAATHAVDCWQVAVSELRPVRVLSDDEVVRLSTGTVDGPRGTSVSMWKGQLHSFDGEPSHVTRTGARHWHWLGQPHREGGLPAVEFPRTGMGYWMQHGVFKRDGGLRVVDMLSSVVVDQAYIE